MRERLFAEIRDALGNSGYTYDRNTRSLLRSPTPGQAKIPRKPMRGQRLAKPGEPLICIDQVVSRGIMLIELLGADVDWDTAFGIASAAKEAVFREWQSTRAAGRPLA
jgi:hypothetical protein